MICKAGLFLFSRPSPFLPSRVPLPSDPISHGFHHKRVFSDSGFGSSGVPKAEDRSFPQPPPFLIHVSYYLFLLLVGLGESAKIWRVSLGESAKIGRFQSRRKRVENSPKSLLACGNGTGSN